MHIDGSTHHCGCDCVDESLAVRVYQSALCASSVCGGCGWVCVCLKIATSYIMYVCMYPSLAQWLVYIVVCPLCHMTPLRQGRLNEKGIIVKTKGVYYYLHTVT